MTSKKNIEKNYEINLEELIVLVWNKKWIIILFSILCTLPTYFYLNSKVEEVPIYKTSTKIKAISSFDEL